MRFLIVGNGGREHAILKSLAKNQKHLYYYTGKYNNPSMDKLATHIEKVNHPMMIAITAKHYKIDIVVIGSETYLEEGLVNLLEDEHIKCIGPNQELALLETSKSFARQLMTHSNLNQYCPKYKVFDEYSKTTDYIQYMNHLKNYVIKADGLHGGKGVKVSGEHLSSVEEGFVYCNQVLESKEKVVIEEKLIGDEFSLMSFTDGKTFRHMPPVKDFKRAYENDKGPNTGSMGSVSYANHLLPFLTEDDIKTCHMLNERIIYYLQKHYKNECIYQGILYGSYMKTENGIKIIEFNTRFGDPECINVLSILKTDLSLIFKEITENNLDKLNVEFENKSTCCRYLVPKGYPDNPVKDHEVYIDDKIDRDSVISANISVEYKNDAEYFYELGSRTLAIIGVADDMRDAVKHVEEQMKYISGPLYSRNDIGKEMSQKIDYKDAGVNIDEGNKVVKNIQKYVESTFNDNVISYFGDFAGLYQINEDQVLVSSTDGVGTKSVLVLDKYGPEKGYEMLGHDLVNHCVNDILVKGAKPLFFLDYYASSKIKAEYVQYFVKGLSDACKEAGCVLIGGETAEMPDIYHDNKCDIAGTIVGIVEKERIIDGKENIEEGDLILGLPSSGPHTNGYSLIRKLVDETTPKDIIDELCASHRCYYQEIMRMLDDNMEIKGLCHITGGGWLDNPERIMPDGLKMELDESKIQILECFKYLQKKGQIEDSELLRTFNCGIGMLVYVRDNGQEYENVIGRIVKKV